MTRETREAVDGELKARFLAEYPKRWTIKRSLKAIGVSRSVYERWMRTDAEFAQEADCIREDILDELEYSLLVQGGAFHVDNPQEYGRYKNANTAAAIFLLKSSKRYRNVADVQAHFNLQVNGVDMAALGKLAAPLPAIDTTAQRVEGTA